jgi:hypothetical protein
MKLKTIALLALSVPAFFTGTMFGVAAVGQPPVLSELQDCALWNKNQTGIRSNWDSVPLGFEVQRKGDTLNVSCTRRPAVTQESFWGHP